MTLYYAMSISHCALYIIVDFRIVRQITRVFEHY